jgi:hypothetical protein
LYIEPEDLLHALIREDRGEFSVIGAEVFPGATAAELPPGEHRPFFSDAAARTLLRELHEDPDPLRLKPPAEKREPAPQADMPVSHSLKRVLELAANFDPNHRKTIEPLDLLAGIVEDSGSRLAQLLRECGITRESL